MFCTAAAHFNYCSVDSEKIPSVLPPLTTMLVIEIDYTFFTGIAHLNLQGSPKSVGLPYFCGAPLFLWRSPISAVLP